MNLLYAGKLQAMPARYRTDDGRFEVIRPLIMCSEERIRVFAEEHGFPILPCNLCGSQPGLQRDRMADLLTQLEGQIPNVKSVMLAALGNVSPTHLLDAELELAWQARPAHIRPKPEPVARATHSPALPVESYQRNPANVANKRQLPVLAD
jgi:tRNA 2-thiocytidine biosynthesis protein TtcA